MRPDPLQKIPPHAKKVFDGIIFDIWQWEQEQFDGSVKVFEKATRPDTVVIIPTTSDRKILLLEEDQPGRSTIVTLPAGRADVDGEDGLTAAKRELKEETGYESDDWELLSARHPETKIDWVVYLFIARNCRKTCEACLDPGERITLREVTLDELLALMEDPRYRGNSTMVEFIKAKYHPPARALLETKLFG